MGETVSSAFKSDHLKTSSCEAERHRGFPSGSVVKTLPATQEMQADVLHPPVRKIPWRRTWQPTPVFLPGESHGQKNLTGYNPRGCEESDMTDRYPHTHTHTHTHTSFYGVTTAPDPSDQNPVETLFLADLCNPRRQLLGGPLLWRTGPIVNPVTVP